MDGTTLKNSQRSHTNEQINGPRVSFNKDVHVKRIGRAPSEKSGGYGSSIAAASYTRELPHDLSEKQLLREAEKVIAQNDRIKCTADSPGSLAGIRLQDDRSEDRGFNSLPYRRKSSSKPLGRSVSDASQKKIKKPSIFSIFSKRSDPNLSTSSGNASPSATNKRIRKPVGRSKSDVGYNSFDDGRPADRSRSQTLDRKRNQRAETVEPISKVKKKAQLSPISENPPDDKKYGFNLNDRKPLRHTKSEERSPKAATDRNVYSNSATIDFASRNGPTLLSRSIDNLHSSQMPPQKPPLTKGRKVEGIVKRLSMERTTPPPALTSPAFSYTRSPTERIVYAQVMLDESDEQPKEMTTKFKSSFGKSSENTDQVDNVGHSSTVHIPYENGDSRRNRQNQNNHRERVVNIEKENQSHGNYLSSKRFNRQSSNEPPIVPNIRQMYDTEHLADRRRLLESKINGRKYDFNRTHKNERLPMKGDGNARLSSPIRHTLNRKYYPETRIDDEFCHDQDAILREEERRRHKQYLDNELRSDKMYGDSIPLTYSRQQKLKSNEFNHNPTLHSDNASKHEQKLQKTNAKMPYMADNIKYITELFLKRECQHSESLHPSKKRYDFIFRERSIDDGSHFDPRLDKYPEPQHVKRTATINAPTDKKTSNLKKVKDIFSITFRKKQQPAASIPKEVDSSVTKINSHNNDMTQRDIALRRRLSTPRASPLPKHDTPNSKIASSTPKTSWFKSLERLPKDRSKVKRSNTSISSSTPRPSKSSLANDPLTKNMRFFGDTDQESKPKLYQHKSRDHSPAIQSNHKASNNAPHKSDKLKERTSSSMFNLNRRVDSSESISADENIDIGLTSKRNGFGNKMNRRQYYSTEYLENDEYTVAQSPYLGSRSNRSKTLNGHRSKIDRNESNPKSYLPTLQERNGRSSSETRALPLDRPRKPARDFGRRRAMSHDQFLDSSGTEGDSSQQSVVYLHATTIGNIPQPYVASSRRSISQRTDDSLPQTKPVKKPVQPMVRTSSNTVSLTAPWAPRHQNGEYVINYNQWTPNRMKTQTNGNAGDNPQRARSVISTSSKNRSNRT